jgi:hypothetical protein
VRLMKGIVANLNRVELDVPMPTSVPGKHPKVTDNHRVIGDVETSGKGFGVLRMKVGLLGSSRRTAYVENDSCSKHRI